MKETIAERMLSGQLASLPKTHAELTPIPFGGEDYDELNGEETGPIHQELWERHGTRRESEEKQDGPTYVVPPAKRDSVLLRAAATTPSSLKTGPYESKYGGLLNGKEERAKEAEMAMLGGTQAVLAEEPPMPVVGHYSDTDDGTESRSGSSSSGDNQVLDADWERAKGQDIAARLQQMELTIKKEWEERARANEEAKKAKEEELQEKLRVAEEELKKLKEETDSKKKQKEFDDQIKSANLQAPRTTEVKQWATMMRSMGAFLKERPEFTRWAQEVTNRAEAEGWPEALTKLDAKLWDYAEETPLHTRARREMYSLMMQTVDTNKHYHKVRSVELSGKKENAQALWRNLHKYFATGKRNGDLDAVKNKILKTTMWNNGINVTEYGLECQRLEKVKADMGVPSDEQLELIPQYIKGLSRDFDGIREHLKTQIQDGTEYTLLDVIAKVEERAVHDGTLDKVPKKTGQVYSGVAAAAGQRRGQKGNRRPKSLKQQVDQLKQTVVNLEHLNKTQLGTTTGTGKKMCKFGIKCWGRGCKHRHPAGWKANTATCGKCNRTGHTTEEHGQCFRCKKHGHYSRECPEAAGEVQQNVQVAGATAGAAPVEMYVVGDAADHYL